MDPDRIVTRAGRASALVAAPVTALACALVSALLLGSGDAHAQPDDEAADTAADTAASDQPAGDDGATRPGQSRDLRITQICIDKTIANRLAVKRKRRGAVDRLFVKQARHEFTIGGGYYSSDLFSGTYIAGGSYTYHMTEDTAVEFSGGWTHANADVIKALEDSRGQIIDDDFSRVLFVDSLLIWTPVYGKLRLGGTILRFDLHLDLGVGVVDSETSRGASGVAGFGLKLFLGRAVAFRIDARNHVFRQELLDERFLVNDLSVMSGFSLYLPFRN